MTGIGRHKIGRLGVMPYKNSWNTPSPRAGGEIWLIDWWCLLHPSAAIARLVCGPSS